MCLDVVYLKKEKKRLLRDLPSEIIVKRLVTNQWRPPDSPQPLYRQAVGVENEPDSCKVGVHEAGNFPFGRRTCYYYKPGFHLFLNLPLEFNHFSKSSQGTLRNIFQTVRIKKSWITEVGLVTNSQDVSYNVRKTAIVCKKIEVLDPNAPIL
jgi:hypothetical protein